MQDNSTVAQQLEQRIHLTSMNNNLYHKALVVACITAATLSGCSKSYHDSPEEDYTNLFPWQGISKPVRDKWNLNPVPCTPNAELTSYIYNPLKQLPDSRRYTVRIRCTFREYTASGTLTREPSSRYRVMFINEHGLYQTIGSYNSAELHGRMRNGEEWEHSFTAHSGYPLFISVYGLGPQGSSIKANIEAISEDGLLRIEPLGTEQFQNNEGPNYIKQPYCEYILLP